MAKIFEALVVALGWCLVTRGVISQTACPTCQVDCTNASLAKHSLCLNSTTSACSPTGPTVNTIDAATQTLILNLHNDYRSLVRDGGESRGAPGPQPAAGNAATGTSLPDLIWDGNLATVAQAWANQCQFASDTLRNVVLTTSTATTPNYVGQNAYARLDFASALPANSPFALQTFVRQALSTWYNEVASFNSANVASYKYNAANGKYSQLVWGATTAVGCGFVQWNYPNNRIARILFCDYGPGGNVLNKPMYTPANATNTSPPAPVPVRK